MPTTRRRSVSRTRSRSPAKSPPPASRTRSRTPRKRVASPSPSPRRTRSTPRRASRAAKQQEDEDDEEEEEEEEPAEEEVKKPAKKAKKAKKSSTPTHGGPWNVVVGAIASALPLLLAFQPARLAAAERADPVPLLFVSLACYGLAAMLINDFDMRCCGRSGPRLNADVARLMYHVPAAAAAYFFAGQARAQEGLVSLAVASAAAGLLFSRPANGRYRVASQALVLAGGGCALACGCASGTAAAFTVLAALEPVEALANIAAVTGRQGALSQVFNVLALIAAFGGVPVAVYGMLGAGACTANTGSAAAALVALTGLFVAGLWDDKEPQ